MTLLMIPVIQPKIAYRKGRKISFMLRLAMNMNRPSTVYTAATRIAVSQNKYVNSSNCQALPISKPL